MGLNGFQKVTHRKFHESGQVVSGSAEEWETAFGKKERKINIIL